MFLFFEKSLVCLNVFFLVLVGSLLITVEIRVIHRLVARGFIIKNRLTKLSLICNSQKML